MAKKTKITVAEGLLHEYPEVREEAARAHKRGVSRFNCSFALRNARLRMRSEQQIFYRDLINGLKQYLSMQGTLQVQLQALESRFDGYTEKGTMMPNDKEETKS